MELQQYGKYIYMFFLKNRGKSDLSSLMMRGHMSSVEVNLKFTAKIYFLISLQTAESAFTDLPQISKIMNLLTT